MNRSKIKFFTATVLLFVFLLTSKMLFNEPVLIEKLFITDQDALSSIVNNNLILNKNTQDNTKNSLYGLYKIHLNKEHLSQVKLSVLSGQEFYVFQDNQLIYSKDSNNYYHGKSEMLDQYINIPYNPNDNEFRDLHSINIRSQSPLKLLIRNKEGVDADKYISFPDIEKKEISDVINLNSSVIKINTYGKSINNQKYIPSSIQINSKKINNIFDAKIKIRGHSSIDFPKKQFNIIFNEKQKFNNQILKKNKLTSFYIDKSLIRNKICHDLFSLFRNKKSSVDYCHLIINDNYEGLYLLCEHPEENFKNLVVGSTQFSFLLQIDRGPHDFVGVKLNSDYVRAGYHVEYPKKINKVDQEKINEKIIDLERLIIAQDFSIIDINSFVDFIIFSELIKNIDAYRLNTYLSFINNKFSIDYVWDFDLSCGAPFYNDGFSPKNFVINSDIKTALPYWWQILWSSEDFQEKIKERYSVLRKNILSTDFLQNRVNEIYFANKESMDLNFKKWEILQSEIWPNKFSFNTHKEEVDYLINWFKNRLIWLDSQWLQI